MTARTPFVAPLLLALLLLATIPAISQLDTALFHGMSARSIGPAGMSGRIASIDAVASNPDIIYVGASTGGVWKSTDGGIVWNPVFDTQPVAAIGAVAVFQPNPSIVWAGTGEGNPRNSASVGNGVYKSLDGGETWMHAGLDKTERIHRIVLHPQNENVAFTAAMGQMWGENSDRGVFKTTDGGKTWKKTLYVNEKTGCAELVIDPNNPNKLFAAMWEYRRWPWFFKSGGSGSGLYVSNDAGETWKRLGEKEGLPAGDLGRMGLAVSKNVPDVVYALVEAKKNALYRSENGGRSWRLVNNSPNVNSRPFYYADIRLDPQNENRLYSLQTNLLVSEDAGKSFNGLANRIHVDYHALWIHPTDGNFLISGNDGGLAISRDRGRTWRFIENIPLAQFYHISVDMERPFNIYGGLQDNGSWRGPSEIWEDGGIRNWHWEDVGGGDGFAVLVDASNPDCGYSMSQGGALGRFNRKTGEYKSIRPWGPDSVDLRFNWNAGIAQDPFDTKTIYYGSQFLHKSTDRGDSWTIRSGDLTTNDTSRQKQRESGGLTKDVTAAENFCTILTIAPSTVQRDIIWIGTDDGCVQLTTNGGATWKNVGSSIPGVPKTTWVSHVEASKFDAGTAFVVFDDHRRSNWSTYVFRTTDFGKTWTSLTTNDPTAGSHGKSMWGYALVIEQDPVKKDLLYLGTEFGLWISQDDGAHWSKWTHGLPTVSTMALIIHPRDHDLVIGTHGRAAYVLDDVRPLRSATKAVLEEYLHVFDIPATYQHYVRSMAGYGGPGDAMFQGENRPYGALVTYSINPRKEMLKDPLDPEEKGDDAARGDATKRFHPDSIVVKFEVVNETGSVIRKFEDKARRGINRTAWNLRVDGVRMPRISAPGSPAEDRNMPQGAEVLPGTYIIRAILGKDTAQQGVTVLGDPRISLADDARKAKFELIAHVQQRVQVASEAVERIVKMRRAIDQMMELTKDRKDSIALDLRKAGQSLKKELTTVADLFVDEPNRVQGMFRNPKSVSALLGSVLYRLRSSLDAPNSTEKTFLTQAEGALQSAVKELNTVVAGAASDFQKKLDAANVTVFPVPEKLELDWKPKK